MSSIMVIGAMPQSPPTRAIPTPSTTPPTDHPAQTRRGSSAGYSSSNFSLPTENASPDRPSDYEDIMDEDTISPLDPRRFTPTLHASLVSEILALRRDVESKTKAIDVLERSLDESRIESDDLSDRLAKSTRETRSLKHQLNLLEGGSSSALTELAKERDTALDNITDVRKKLDQAQKKARGRDEELERSLKLWDRERESWETNRRALERKVHVVEGRLKVVLNEVAAAQAAGSLRSTAATNPDEATLAKEEALGKDSDSASILSSSQGPRRTSVTSVSSSEDDYRDFHNVRYSVASLANVTLGKSDGMNLADELAFDEEDEFDLADDDMAPESPEALPEERPTSVHSQISQTMGMGAKARKILGLSMESGIDGQGVKVDGVSEADTSVKVTTRAAYQDTGIQYSPPPSPRSPKFEYPLSQNDRNVSGQTKDSGTSTVSADMVSTSCQTVGDIPTPPRTPKLDELIPQASAPEQAIRAITVSTAVQTEQDLAAEPEKPIPAVQGVDSDSLQIPMIAIHPPHSEPPSPRGSVVLPPQTKSVSCQANFGPMVSYQTVGMQTEPIRIDQRPVKLPASLLPSAIPDFPPSKHDRDPPIQPYRAPPPRTRFPIDVQPPPLPPKAPSRNKPPGRVQAYPGNNDNGPLSEESTTGMRRPLRSSSLFAGFEGSSDEGSPESTKDIFTDDAFLNRPTATYKLRRGKLISTQERSTLDDPVPPEVIEHLLDPDAQLSHASGSSVRDVEGGPRQRAGTVASGGRQQDIRRAAMISNGASAHQKIRARSPSEPSFDSASGASSIAPPFPVPIRLSSRKFPAEGSDGRQSPTPSNPRNFSDRGRAPAVRRPILRRVRSAAAMSQTDHTERPSTRSSPAMSVSSQTPESPHYPPLPFDDVTARQGKYGGRRRSVRRAGAPHTLVHQREDSAATSVQPTSVVDAIAQTMVGEWMFKYVRRRRSFGGVGETKESWEGRNADEVSASITNSGVRHKRWVWLAPYERAVMWSSKQPTSGPALLGKSGRKLTIQSVLDVKDDNPLPKGTNAQNQFNRSILILTPQRALKFTAMSIERHYVWLSALSFLSHSTMGVQDLASLPPAPQEEISSPVPAPALRRNPIRDSIKIAKGRPRPGPKPKRSFNQPEPVPELPPELETADSIDTAADPPTVPRFSNHARKRSNPTTRMPVLRNFSSQATMPSIASTRGSSEANTPSHAPGVHSGRSSLSHRTSEASTGTGNFFDAVGTVRMEAFIDQTESNRSRAPRQRKRKTSSPWSAGNPAYLDLDIPAPVPALATEDGDYSRHEDPFRGF